MTQQVGNIIDMTPAQFARARFDSFFVDGTPAWSSFLLERVFEEAADDDAAFSGFVDCVADRPLTRVLANLIEDVSRLLVVRRSGGSRRFVVDLLAVQPTETLALVAAWTVPFDTWLDGEPEECLHTLLGTVFHDEARLLLLDGEPVS